MHPSSRHHPRLVQTAACLGFAVVLIDVSVVNVALDALRTAFGAAVTDLQWVVNAYALVFAATLLMAGALGDRLGAKRVFIAGYAIFTLSSIGCGIAHSMEALIAWRLVQGIGASLLVPNSLAVLRVAFDDAAAFHAAHLHNESRRTLNRLKVLSVLPEPAVAPYLQRIV